MRVVVCAEGAWELKGAAGHAPAPGQRIAEEALGPAHLLVRRVLIERAGGEAGKVEFEAPLRVAGRAARGSDLRDRTSLRRLLTWPRPDLRPDLSVVLVDADGDRQCSTTIQNHVADLPFPPIVGVAVQEFEAWLIADHANAASTLGRALNAPPAPEGLERGYAKRHLQSWVDPKEEREQRKALVRAMDLERVERTCRSFASFSRDLQQLAQSCGMSGRSMISGTT